MSDFLKSFLVLGAAFIGGAPAWAVTVESTINQEGHAPQAQLFYGSSVSRVASPSGQACMVSTGSPWAETGMARLARDMDTHLQNRVKLDEAFNRSAVVDLKDLSSNTPYIAFLIDKNGSKFLRFSTGFEINSDTVEITYGSHSAPADAFEKEARGDTGTIRHRELVEDMFRAFTDEKEFTFVARSQKKAFPEEEHYIRYTFDGLNEAAALQVCLNDLEDPEFALAPTPKVTFALTPVQNSDARNRLLSRAMACNRDLDVEETELVELNGPISGFSSPLSHALLQRDTYGEIQNIWSGDLWRIAKRNNGYVMAFSNSITRQGPLDAQTEKACTQMGSAFPIVLDGQSPDVVNVAAVPDGPVFSAPRIARQTVQGIAVPGIVNATIADIAQGGTGGSTAITRSRISQIVTPPSNNPDPKGAPVEQINSVPIPPTVFLLLLSILGVVLFRSHPVKD